MPFADFLSVVSQSELMTYVGIVVWFLNSFRMKIQLKIAVGGYVIRIFMEKKKKK